MGAVDAFAWQIAASVAIPGFTIHQICHFSGKGIQTAFPKIPKGPRLVLSNIDTSYILTHF